MAFSLVSLVPVAMSAQQSLTIPPGRVAVTVVLANNFKYGNAGAVIIRRRGQASADMIIMPAASASPGYLAAAAQMLEVLMNQDGDVSSREGLFRVGSPITAPANSITIASKVLANARNSSPHKLDGMGISRTTPIFLRNQYVRAKLLQTGKIKIIRQQ